MTDHTLRIDRHLPCKPDQAWAFWTDPDHLKNWFFPTDSEIIESDFHPRPGAEWRTLMRGRDSGMLFPVRGTFQLLDPPHKLVFTHGWEDETGTIAVLTRVTITLTAANGGTALTLIQEGLASDDSRAGHLDGWSQVLENLAAWITR